MRAIALSLSMLVFGVLADAARAQSAATGGAEYGAQAAPAAPAPRALKPGQAGTFENRPPRVGGGEYRRSTVMGARPLLPLSL